MSSLEKKWSDDELKFTRVTCDDMQCKDCRYKTEETIRCEVFEDRKPNAVLLGDACPEFDIAEVEK